MKKVLSSVTVFAVTLTMFFQWTPLAEGEVITESLNLGFEDGIGDWVTVGAVTVETYKGISVDWDFDGDGYHDVWKVHAKGNKMAVLKPDSDRPNMFPEVASALGLSQSSKDYIAGLFPYITDAAYIYKDLELKAGDEFEIGWNYVATDYEPFNDASFVSLVNMDDPEKMAVVNGVNVEVSVLGATVRGTETVPATGNYTTGNYGSTGWQIAKFKVLYSGTYRLGLAVYNLEDTSFDPYLFVDDGRGTTFLNESDFGYVQPDPYAPKPPESAITVFGTSKTWINQNQTISFTVDGDASNIASVSVEGSISGNVSVTYNEDTGTYSFVADKHETFTIIVTDNQGKLTAAVVEALVDKTAPTGTITVRDNEFKQFISAVTFGLFFKQNADVSITADDDDSGIAKIEYYNSASELSQSQLEALEPDEWIEATSFSVPSNEKFIVYARFTDNVGNVSVINSKGVVVYTDSDISEDSAYFDPDTTKDGYRDITVGLQLNGNALQSVKLGSDVLQRGVDYTADGDTVTLKKEYLKSVVNGTVTFTFTFAPMGETFEDGVSVGDAPAAKTFTVIQIIHAEVPAFTSDLSGTKIYTKGDTAETLSVEAAVTDNGEISYQWYLNGTAIDGATSASYTPDTENIGVYDYYVIATNTNTSVNGDTTAVAQSGTCRVVVNNITVNEADIADDAPKMTIQEDNDTILDAVLTNEELENGYDISISLKVQAVSNPPKDDENAVYQIIGDNILGQYIDISIIKTLIDSEGNRNEQRVSQLNMPITITIEIPEELLPKNGEQRKFSIVRVHNGVATVLEDLDDVLNTITIQTDRFSTYAIVYTDKALEIPDTGDTTPALALAMVFAASLLLVIAQKRRKQAVSK